MHMAAPNENMPQQILIIGGSWVGIALAHKLLKHTYPSFPKFKVTLVSASTHFCMNVAMPRAVVPGLVADDAIFQPIAPNFSQYPGDSFTFVKGTAEHLDEKEKVVRIIGADGPNTLSYDIAVIATGSSYAGDDMPFKQAGSYQESLERLHRLQQRIKDGSDIVIGGAGPTGVETAGEIAYEYGRQKKVTLISSDDGLLPSVRDDVGKAAAKELERLGVTIIRKTKVESSVLQDQRTELRLSDGKTLATDVYISTIGVKANTAFLPAHLLNAEGKLVVDQFQRLKGTSNVYAAGDVVEGQRKQLKYAEDQVIHLATTLDNVLKGKKAKPYKPNDMVVMAATLGRRKGTGLAGYFRLPSFLIYQMKGKTMGIDKAKPYVSGQKFITAGSM